MRKNKETKYLYSVAEQMLSVVGKTLPLHRREQLLLINENGETFLAEGALKVKKELLGKWSPERLGKLVQYGVAHYKGSKDVRTTLNDVGLFHHLKLGYDGSGILLLTAIATVVAAIIDLIESEDNS